MQRQAIVTGVFWIAGAYAALCVLMYVLQGRLLFQPSSELEATPADVGLGYEDVELESAPGERVHAWFVPCPRPRALVVFCHGNAGNISHRIGTLELLHGLGLSTLILDYPGYGRSPGEPGEAACGRAVGAALAWARARADGLPVVLWGRSMGGAVAATVAARVAVDALVVEAAFTSLPDLAQELYPWLPARRLCRFRFDTRHSLAAIRAPKLLVHSRDDEVVPYPHAERLLEAAAPPKRLVPIGGDHNGGYFTSGSAYRAAVDAFLTAVAGPVRG